MIFRPVSEREIGIPLFSAFQRRQVVTKCWRREGEGWVIRDDPFIDQWSEEDYRFLVRCLQNTVRTGGLVYGAFAPDGRLKGFCSVEAAPFGTKGQYLDLSSIHVSEELRGAGVGRRLFLGAAVWARARGAKKLYISAHSAAETQAFYRGLGCVDAREINREHAQREPFDCQLEYEL